MTKNKEIIYFFKKNIILCLSERLTFDENIGSII